MKKILFPVLVLLTLFIGSHNSYSQGTKEQPLVYFIPNQDAQNVSPTTSLAIRQGTVLAANAADSDIFEVVGSKSGLHSGRTVLSDDQLTLLFSPDKSFEYGETVTVTIRPGLKTADNTPIAGTSYQFTVIAQAIPQSFDPDYFHDYRIPSQSPAETPKPSNEPTGGGLYHTHPEFNDIMTATVTIPAQNTADGYIFVAAISQFYDGPSASIIFDDTGEPLYIKIESNDNIVTNFRKQTVNGTDYLTYYSGYLQVGYSLGATYVLNSNYQLVNIWTLKNGYGSDLHESLLLDNGHAIVLAYVPIPFDLTPYGGPANGTLVDTVIQEQDANKNVVFEWHGSEHMPIGDTRSNLNTTEPIDYMHTNGIDVDNDGNWLISLRNYSEITKIDRQTGDLIWRLGGNGNEFTFTNDIGFDTQHNINRLENGNITIFDNGTNHEPPHSRAIEYEMDEIAKTVTLVWSYPDDTSIFSTIMGNVQRLPNGNSIIGWGSQPKVTEVQNDGTVALDMQLGGASYRAFRFPWEGTPTERPRAVVESNGNPTAVTLYTSWNGATDITGYDIYAGPTATTTVMIDNLPRNGFETEIPLTGLASDTCFFKVKPVHSEGNSTPFSNIVFRVDLPVCWDQLSHAYMPIFPR
ncbi:MAG: arylsulfotransferase family protein [Candidatus Promineifilaceae bacterium]